MRVIEIKLPRSMVSQVIENECFERNPAQLCRLRPNATGSPSRLRCVLDQNELTEANPTGTSGLIPYVMLTGSTEFTNSW
jgi:hypothetical protein